MVIVEKKRGIQSSGYLFLFWVFAVVCFLPEFLSHISAGPYQVSEWIFFLYYRYYGKNYKVDLKDIFSVLKKHFLNK